jgi:predicted Zn-dependent protease
MNDMREQPWDFGTAAAKAREASAAQKQAEDFVKTAYRQYAEAERAYRKALATRIVELRADKTPATVAQDVARGDTKVADLKFASTVADGVRQAAANAVFRASADRQAVKEFITWSFRRDLAEGAPNPIEPVYSDPIGGRR